MFSVLPPLLPLSLLPPPELLSPPQAETPTANAAIRQPEAAIQREFKEPLLMGNKSTGGDSSHRSLQPRRFADRGAECLRGRTPRCGGADGCHGVSRLNR